MAVFTGSNTASLNDTICMFTTSGSFVPQFSGTIEVLVVAGGGAGGNGTGFGYESGGGGGGGLIYNSQFSVTAGSSYTVIVGAGGASRTSTENGLNGGNSVFGALTAIGGGGGASSSSISSAGTAGGSGGGGSHAGGAGGAGTAGQGFAGATPAQGSSGGGGGGAGTAGRSTSGNADGRGGDGLPFSISGSLQYYAGGGGGSRHTNISGGLGGGGAGWNLVGYGNGTAGSPNTGGGGGGANQPATNTGGGAGGSGIVIVRFSSRLGDATVTNGNVINSNSIVLNLDANNFKSVPVVSAEVLVVAGGGSGGVDNGGGGGGGGVIYNSAFSAVPGTSYTVTVGAGGASRPGASDDGPGNNGGNSVFGALTAVGGSGGTGWVNPTLPPGSSSYTGGSGAGQSASTGTANAVGVGIATVNQGFNGGAAVGGYAGGGGGAGGPGGNASSGNVGAGGRGFFSSISGTLTVYAGGGAGGFDAINGLTSTLPVSQNGTVKKLTQTSEDSCAANTGHGGNGSNHNNHNSGGGGSGIVIVRYAGPQRATGGNITTVGSDTVHTFTTSGTFTPTGWTDLSGFGNNGTLVNGVVYNSASGGSLVFDGIDDRLNVSLNRAFSNVLTVECWYRGTKTSRNHLWNFAGENLHCNFNDGPFGLWMYWNGNGGNRVRYNGNFTDGSINHLVFTHNDSTNKVFLNGTELPIAESGGTQTFPNIGSNGFNVGDVAFGGNIYAIKIQDRALTAAEVRQNFDATKMRFYGENSQVPATSGVDLKQVRPDLPSGYYWIRNSRMPNALRMYVDMTEEGGGYDFFPMQGNGTSIGSTNGVHSGIALGLDLVYPRSKQHWIAMSNFVRNVLGDATNQYFTTVYAVHRETSAGAGSRGGNYTGDIMRNPAFYGTGTPDWRVPDGGRWWLRDTTFSEPNGDYTAYNFLGGYTHPNPYTGQDLQFNDATGQNYVTGGFYLLSTNSKP